MVYNQLNCVLNFDGLTPYLALKVLEKLMQQDYELFINTQGYSQLTEAQWNWLITSVEKELMLKEKNHD